MLTENTKMSVDRATSDDRETTAPPAAVGGLDSPQAGLTYRLRADSSILGILYIIMQYTVSYHAECDRHDIHLIFKQRNKKNKQKIYIILYYI